MQVDHAPHWWDGFAVALARSAHKINPGVVRQVNEVTRDPARRFRSSELLEFAREHDESFSPRLLADWPVWGLLALAETEGRGAGEGVGRSWSVGQTLVFLTVVRVRARGHRRRADLANLPTLHWLLFGTEYVPLSQARRALTTWGRAAQKLSAYRFRTDIYQHLLRHPEVRAAIESGAVPRSRLVQTIGSTLATDERDEAAALFSRLARPGADEAEVRQIMARQHRAWDTIDRGLDALEHASDEQLLRARELYVEHNIVAPQERLREAERAATVRHWKNEGETACANAITYLAIATDEAESTLIANLTERGAKASLTLTSFLTSAAVTHRAAHDSIERAKRRRHKRMTQE
jgi:hypothetical protein